MSSVDGNAAAGLLRDAFGFEMTAAITECASCGTRGRLAEAKAYLRGPGAVLRCRVCNVIAAVVTEVRGVNCVDVSGFRALQMPER